ncbi:hypothetical protein L4D20_16865 [Vibrio kyushuensis]|uniref:hypothetical protein n=1 Tax=Vibrio kyushuensis TaxID=2910249 RepID=UPI003D0BD15D
MFEFLKYIYLEYNELMKIGAILIFSLSGWVLVVRNVYKVETPLSIMLVLCLYITLAYPFYLFELGSAWRVFFLAIGFLLTLFSFFYFYSSRTSVTNLLIPLLEMSLVGFFALAFYVNIPSEFTLFGNDDFSHWALASRLVSDSGGLFKVDSPIIFKHYPPGSAILNSLFISFFDWSEKAVVLAQNIFIFSCNYALASLLLKNKKVVTQFSAVIIYFMSSQFMFNTYELSVDLLISSLFAACVAVVYRYGISKRALYILVPSLFALSTIKQIGFLLSLTVSMYAFFLVLRSLFRVGFKDKKIWLRSTFYLVATSSYFISIISWQIYTKYHGTWRSLGRDMLTNNDICDGSNCLKLKIFEQFNEAFFSRDLILFGSDTYSLVLFLLSVLVILLYSFNLDKRLRVLSLSIVLGGCIYLSFMLYSYMNFFSEYEALKVASYRRYASTYFYAVSMILILFVIKAIFQSTLRKLNCKIAFSIFIPVVLFLSVPGFSSIYNPPVDIGNRDLKNQMIRLSKIAQKHAVQGDKFYHISQGTMGYHNLLFRYNMYPFDTQFWCWSIGKPLFSGDVWTCDNRLEELIKGFEWLVISKADKTFWDANSDYFEKEEVGKPEAVFRISRDAFDNPTFERVR